jgi:hypothetical protein
MEDEQIQEIIDKLDRIETNCMTQVQAQDLIKKLDEIATELSDFRAEYSKS